MQGATDLHHEITDALLPQAHPVLHDATTLDAAVDMLVPEPPLVERLISISSTLRIGSIKMKQSRRSQRTSSDCILVRKASSLPLLSLTWVLIGGIYGSQR